MLSYRNTKEEALTEEIRLQQMHNVVKSEKYYNESLASVNGMFGRDVSGKNNPNYGKKQAMLLECCNQQQHKIEMILFVHIVDKQGRHTI